jgi:antitoxin component of MazEF toxin-antitoxin module
MAKTEKYIANLIEIGNSSGVIIKKKFLKNVGIGANSSLQISCDAGKIIIKPLKPIKFSSL